MYKKDYAIINVTETLAGGVFSQTKMKNAKMEESIPFIGENLDREDELCCFDMSQKRSNFSARKLVPKSFIKWHKPLPF